MTNQQKLRLGFQLHEGDIGGRSTDLQYEPKFLVDNMGIPTHMLPTKKFRKKPTKGLTKKQIKTQKKLIRKIQENQELFKSKPEVLYTPPPVQRLR